MPDGYDRDRHNYDNNTRGRIFENGTYRYFRDRENGYVQQSKKFRAAGVSIRFDKIKDVRGLIYTIEEKSGRMDSPKDEKQLEVVRALLDKGEIQQHVLRTVEGEYRSPEVQKLIDGLVRDFKEKFTHQVIPRHVAREIWAIGLQRETGKQLELPGVREKAGQEKAQELQKRRDKIALLAKARGRAEKFRNMLRFRDGATRGRAEAPGRVERNRQAQEQAKLARQARETPEARVAREAAERVALEFPVPNQLQEREAADTGEHAAREAADAASLERAAAEARAAAAKAREEALRAREVDEKERAQELARLQARGVPPEVVKLLGLGQAQPPSAAVREPPGHAPGVVRGGTGQGQERARGIARDR
ncbi:hypothetical protein IU450_09040 [Nocardia abscessus]|uniref:hypothetical protein n=1 Tax=Nocardia abscessus TaxID=120957 RepID=UPI00189376BF|nr:hypothetical protein [Nocardia abscessus]MBF6336030.1 hypothetical protein [Nocardia abscessus]